MKLISFLLILSLTGCATKPPFEKCMARCVAKGYNDSDAIWTSENNYKPVSICECKGEVLP